MCEALGVIKAPSARAMRALGPPMAFKHPVRRRREAMANAAGERVPMPHADIFAVFEPPAMRCRNGCQQRQAVAGAGSRVLQPPAPP